MMMSPEMYVREHENDTFEQIIAEKDYLTSEIKRLEKIAFDSEKKDSAWQVSPGPDVQFQVYLEYLAELCNFLKDKYNKEIVWGGDGE